jgi:hypothetical protein
MLLAKILYIFEITVFLDITPYGLVNFPPCRCSILYRNIYSDLLDYTGNGERNLYFIYISYIYIYI